MIVKKRLLLWITIVLLVLPMLLAGCGEAETPETQPAPTQGAENSAVDTEPEITAEEGIFVQKIVEEAYAASSEGVCKKIG